MKLILVALVAGLSAAVSAQDSTGPQIEPNTYDADAWLRVPLDERSRRFDAEERDSQWAPLMEQTIRDAVADFDRPLVEVFGANVCSGLPICEAEMPSVRAAAVECRATLCRIEMHWPTGTANPIIGQQLSFLYGIGLDHQGETRGDDDRTRYRVVMIARRRTWPVLHGGTGEALSGS